MKIIERRIVEQQWFETECTKTGWDSHGWVFKDDYQGITNRWEIVEHLHTDKFGNSWIGIAEKETEIEL
jgi:hypothetical protein